MPMDVVLEASPSEVKARLVAGLLPVRSVWFPSMAELRAWDSAVEPLYVRWLGERSFEIGPRIGNIQAARFCPVVRGDLIADGHDRTRMSGQLLGQRFTNRLLLAWTALLILWLAALVPPIQSGAEPVGWLVWWAFLVAATAAAWGVGHHKGGRVLVERLPELLAVANDPGAGADDWG